MSGSDQSNLNRRLRPEPCRSGGPGKNRPAHTRSSHRNFRVVWAAAGAETRSACKTNLPLGRSSSVRGTIRLRAESARPGRVGPVKFSSSWWAFRSSPWLFIGIPFRQGSCMKPAALSGFSVTRISGFLKLCAGHQPSLPDIPCLFTRDNGDRPSQSFLRPWPERRAPVVSAQRTSIDGSGISKPVPSAIANGNVMFRTAIALRTGVITRTGCLSPQTESLGVRSAKPVAGSATGVSLCEIRDERTP